MARIDISRIRKRYKFNYDIFKIKQIKFQQLKKLKLGK